LVTIVEFFDYECPYVVACTDAGEALARYPKDLRSCLRSEPFALHAARAAAANSRSKLAPKGRRRFFDATRGLFDDKRGLTDAIWKPC